MALGIVQGFVDTTSCNQVTGWVWDSDHPDQSRVVTLMSGNQVISSVNANQYRQDLKDNLQNSTGNYMYSIAIPSFLNDGNPHSISIVDGSSGMTLPVSSGAANLTHMCGTPNGNQVSNTDTNTTTVVSGGSAYDVTSPILGLPLWAWGVAGVGLIALMAMHKGR